MRKSKSKTPKAPKTIKKPDLTIEVKNFGPISKGTVSLKNLTVLIGPNNSGKSYIAMLVHALAESYYQRFEPSTSTLSILRRMSASDDLQIIEKNLPELKKWFNSIPPSIIEKFDIPEEISRKIIDEIYKYYYEHHLKDRIEAIYACQQTELIRINENSFKIKITHNGNVSELSLKRNGKAMKINNTLNIDNINLEITYHHTNDEYINNLSSMTKHQIEESRHFMIKDTIEYYNKLIAERSKIPYSYYLPASRTGILQCFRTFLVNIVNNLSFSSTRKNEPDSMQGVVVQFISDIYQMPDKKGPLYDIASEFEQDVIMGEIFMKRLLPGSIPEILYRFNETVIPIHRTSSTVSELAPIILYLKYYIEPGDIMIIEEPEAHLNPQNQRLMAKLLVRLIRAGVYVIITTHSEYLFEQLNNCRLSSKVPKEKRKDSDIEDFILPDEIGAFVFHQDKNKSGYHISKIDYDEDDGISDEEFFKVTESLYDETMKIKDLIPD
ncbi:AAA family ATPase [Candidatus Magnetominusculus dajiuhuensis]|uniref:AAA family ATPase n=1 Tax=Candidatus Magnetominusculus dajiuhuensis TaxID=3137712 RepID=UPI003B433AAC